jgi:hypothetical protein
MEELLSALLAGLFELIGEALLELLFGLLADISWRGLRSVSSAISESVSSAIFEPDRPRRIVFSLILGIILGFVSIAVHPAPFFHPGKVHGTSLLLSPLLTGLVMAAIGSAVKRINRKPVPWESFWGGFAFALGMAVIRFVSTR